MSRETDSELHVDFSTVASEDGPPHDVPGLADWTEVDLGVEAPHAPDDQHHIGDTFAGLTSGYPVEEPRPV